MKIIENGLLITHNPANLLIKNGAIAFDAGRVVDFGSATDIKQKYPDADSIDAKSRVILPGLINCHTHIYSAFARGMAIPNAPISHDFLGILENLWWRLDTKLTMADVRYSAYVTGIDSIKNGVTTIFDHHASFGDIEGTLGNIGEITQELGLRASLCFEVSDRNGEELLRRSVKENVAWLDYTKKRNNSLQKGIFGLHASFSLSDKTLEYCREMAGEAGFHVHVAEGVADVEKTLKMCGKTPVERLRDFDMLGEHSLCVHCVHIHAKDMDILSESATPVVHNPQSNMGNAVGAAPVLDMMKRGITVGLGTDAYTADMFESSKNTITLAKHQAGDPSVMGTEALKMLFENNRNIASRHFGLPLGIIEKGAAADIITVDYRPATPITANNVHAHIAFGMTGAQVDTVIIGGKTVMRGREMVDIDERRIYAEARDQAAKLWKIL